MASSASLKLPYEIKGSHLVDGVSYLYDRPRELFEKIREMAVHDDDLFICGYWKSGNNWIRAIVAAILNQNDLERFENTTFQRENHLDFDFPRASAMPRPAVFWSLLPFHKLPKEISKKKNKIIYIVRHPKDVAVSYYHFHKACIPFGPWDGEWDVFLEAYLSGRVIHGSWYEHARSFFVHHNEHNILFVKYEDLKMNPKDWVKKIAVFLGRPLEEKKLDRIVQITEFNNMKQNHNFSLDDSKYFVKGFRFMRKGKVGDWKSLFTEEQSKRADDMLKALCNQTGCTLYSDNANQDTV